jgi:hypothetical protein
VALLKTKGRQRAAFDKEMRRALDAAYHEAALVSPVTRILEDNRPVDEMQEKVVRTLDLLEDIKQEIYLNFSTLQDVAKEQEMVEKGFIFQCKNLPLAVSDMRGSEVVPDKEVRRMKEIRGLLQLLQDYLGDILPKPEEEEEEDKRDEEDSEEKVCARGVKELKRLSMVSRSLIRFVGYYSIPLAHLIERLFRNYIAVVEFVMKIHKKQLEIMHKQVKEDGESNTKEIGASQQKLDNNLLSGIRVDEVVRLRKEISHLQYQLHVTEETALAKYRKLESTILLKDEKKAAAKEDIDTFLQKIDEVDYYLEEMEKETQTQVKLLGNVASMISEVERTANAGNKQDTSIKYIHGQKVTLINVETQTSQESESKLQVQKYLDYYIYPLLFLELKPKISKDEVIAMSPKTTIGFITKLFLEKIDNDDRCEKFGTPPSTIYSFCYSFLLEKNGQYVCTRTYLWFIHITT